MTLLQMPQKDLLSPGDKDIFAKLLLELCVELDLHYEDEDMFALAPSFELIKAAMQRFEKLGIPVDENVNKIVARFNKSRQ